MKFEMYFIALSGSLMHFNSTFGLLVTLQIIMIMIAMATETCR